MVRGFYFGLDVVVRLSWTGRGGMFLAPAGNPSSLRVGHPDVATEHTDLPPASLPLPVVRGRVRLRGKRVRTTGYSVWEDCAGTGRGNTGVRYRRQLAKIEYWVEGIAVTPYGRSGRLPAGSRQEGFSTTMRARTAQLYLPEATSGCPSSARAGAPVGAKEVYSAPAHPLHNRGTHPARRLKSLKNVQLTTQLC